MNLLIVRNDAKPQACDASLLLSAFLLSQNVPHTLVDSTQLTCATRRAEVARAARDSSLVVVLGGDGTILRTASCVGSSGVPILGINFGNLGFLANSSEDGVVAIVAAALAGEVREERRANLRIDVVCEGDADPWADDGSRGVDASVPRAAFGNDEAAAPLGEGEPFVGGAQGSGADGAAVTNARSFFALNEVAVARGAMGRLVDFTLGVSGTRIADMRGDGLVVATATGSTAYALSAGGPLVAPGFGGLVAVPIAPHSLRSRALLTAENDVVEIDLSRNGADREATLFVDGDRYDLGAPLERVYVRRGPVPTTLLRYSGENFYESVAKTFF